MGSMSMVIDRNIDDEDFICSTEQQPSSDKPKKLLFAGGVDFPNKSLHICTHCRRVKDTQGKWHKIDRRMIFFNDVKLIQDTCDDCRQD